MSSEVHDVQRHRQVGVQGSARSVDGPFWMLLSRARVGILVLDRRGSCLYANDPAGDLLGLARSACLGSGWTSALEHDDAARVSDTLMCAAAEGRDWSLTLNLLRAGGGTRSLNGNGALVSGADGQPLGWVLAIDSCERGRAPAARPRRAPCPAGAHAARGRARADADGDRAPRWPDSAPGFVRVHARQGLSPAQGGRGPEGHRAAGGRPQRPDPRGRHPQAADVRTASSGPRRARPGGIAARVRSRVRRAGGHPLQLRGWASGR